MVNFEIQETNKIKSSGAWCCRCSGLIEHKPGNYRVKYGQEVYHLSCFYRWLDKNIPKMNKRNIFLKDCYIKLKEYMPQILAETITAENINKN